MMRHELWSAILGAYTDVDRLVAEAAGDLPDRAPLTSIPSVPSAPPRTSVPWLETAWRDPQPGSERVGPKELPRRGMNVPLDERDRLGLIHLREKILARLATPWQQLQREEGPDQVRRALTIYLDERIMGQLPEYLRWSWPLLQTDLTGATTGGTEFFRFIDHALDDPKTPQLVFEVYYFCLNHGFVGMHANDIMQLDEHRGRLKARMALPAVALQKPTEDHPELDRLPTRWPTWSYYFLAFVLVVTVTAVLTMLSNYGDGQGYG